MLVGLPLSISILSSLVLASPSARQVQEQSVDILIIGGGNAGLTVASRLSENSSLVVGVLEAGGSALGDPLVDVSYFYCMIHLQKLSFSFSAPHRSRDTLEKTSEL